MNRSLIIKLVIILGVIGLCLVEILPVDKKLKKGIDLAGGTSLIYSIDTTGLTELEKSEIEKQMIRILRNRLDPNNKRNLVWRAHGGGRIEIQMPLPTADTQVKRQRYKDLLASLEGYNLEVIQIRQAMIRLEGVSETQYVDNRSRLFDEMADKWRERMEGVLAPNPDNQEALMTGRQERRDILEALASAQDAYESDRGAQTVALEELMSLQTSISEAGINMTVLDNLYGRWRTLNDPNQTEELKYIAGDDQVQQELIRTYMGVRTEVGFLRSALLDSESGTEVRLGQAWDDLESVNIDFDRLDLLLESSQGEESADIIGLRSRHPLMSGLINELLEAYKGYSEVEGQLDDPEDLKRKLRGSGVLEFRILPKLSEGRLNEGEIETYKERLMTFGPDRVDSNERYVWKKIKDPDDFPAKVESVTAERDGIEYVLASNMPEDNEVMLRKTGGGEWRLTNARPSADSYGRPAVAFSLNQAGISFFFNMTKDNVDRALCILLDDEAFSAPNISGPIYGGVEITGRFTQQEVQDLVDKLNAGALPARLSDQPESENTIGPTLGASNLNAGLQAGFWGLMAVAAFILVYYMVAGSLADIALFMNLLMIMGVMALSRATFTMPGIAGLILTIGMAVDANVLVFERIREEQQRGSSLRMAIKNGYGRAFRTILDANVTTFITALLLWVFASEEVKGFALTLMIGIVSSMITALFVTRSIFDMLTGARIIKNKLKMFQVVKKPEVHWMKARPAFWTISVILVVTGWVCFISRLSDDNSMFSNEFLGGTSIHLVLTEQGAQELTAEAEAAGQTVRDLVEEKVHVEGERLNNQLIQTARVQQIGAMEDQTYEVVTTETNRLTVALRALGGNGDVLSVEQVQAAIREAGKMRGDARMAESVVGNLEEGGGYLLETKQTDRNKVQTVLNNALKMLSKIAAGEVTVAGEQRQVIISVKSGEQASVDEIRDRLLLVAEEVGDPLLVEATVEENNGSFLMTTDRTDEARIKIVMDQLAAAFSGLEFSLNDFETRPIVSDAVRRALEGKLEVLDDLEPQNIRSEPITQELVNQKLYLQPYLGGLLVAGEFGGDRTSTLGKLEERFKQVRFQTEFDQYGRSDLDVFAPGAGKVDAETVLSGLEMAATSDNVFYGVNSQEEWDDFVERETGLFGSALQRTSSFARLTQIDPSVGHQSMQKALVAIVFSLVAIIIYIWVRFGTARFGLAAVAALVHDVSIAMGMVAVSAWVAQTFLSRVLLIDDFKIDLPMIAGFLTVIGYSLNDTIVVFDRVRENRGKLATLSAGIINNSINQSLSRTILTSVSTMIVLVVMYIFGGEGLRGFNFVLIIGVVVGTYSSIGIAAPLLYGAQTEQAAGNRAAQKSGVVRKNNSKKKK